jgi:hypothetical protein
MPDHLDHAAAVLRCRVALGARLFLRQAKQAD